MSVKSIITSVFIMVVWLGWFIVWIWMTYFAYEIENSWYLTQGKVTSYQKEIGKSKNWTTYNYYLPIIEWTCNNIHYKESYNEPQQDPKAIQIGKATEYYCIQKNWRITLQKTNENAIWWALFLSIVGLFIIWLWWTSRKS